MGYAKRSFTITEILIACLVLTLVATFCLINLRSSVQERKQRISLEQVTRKVALAKLLSRIFHDRIYVVAQGSHPVTISLDTASRKTAAKVNILFQQEELSEVSDVIWGQNHSSSGGVRIAFCNGEPCCDISRLGEQIPESLYLKVANHEDLEIRITPKAQVKKAQQLMSPEEIDRVFPKEVLADSEGY
jgi:hypothetical protein